MPVAVREVVHSFIGATNRHELDVIADLFEPNAVFDAGPAFEAPFNGRQAIRGLFEGYYQRMPDLMIVASDIFVNGHEAVGTFDVYATIESQETGPVKLEGWQSGRRLSWKGVYLFTVEPGGKIRSVKVFGDERTVRWLQERNSSTNPL
jgi:ketosteroid isomerase-like protein